MPDVWTPGVDRATGVLITATMHNELLGADGSLNFLGTTHDHSGDAGDGATLHADVWLPFSSGMSLQNDREQVGWRLEDPNIRTATACWLVPAGFGSVTSITVYCQPKGTGNLYRKLMANSVIVGGDADAWTIVNDWAVNAVTAEQMVALVATVANLPVMAAGDVFNFKIDRDASNVLDTVNADVFAIGVKIVYVPA